ncbi:methyltransferase [Stappia sp. GBMRC 2046]|uniref:Methyltransferase n=1 Tax=Stappia sediminis TaxID=2692190 RepID=A0A7X3S9I7_9HYPH|nr:trimethylamine methyltransferase family protein [Stappia sediminis]MXN66943.1 methyltransferase [Stappia sediminis]
MADVNVPSAEGDSPSATPVGRRGRRARKGRENTARLIEQKPFRTRRNTYPKVDAVSVDELEMIHEASLKILEEIGIDFLNEEAKAILKASGADVDPSSDRVRLDRAIVMDAIGKAPSEFTMHARNPEKNLHFGGDSVVWSAVASAPNCVDADNGRRPGNREDFRNLLKLTQYFNIIDLNGGYPVEPVDIHPSVRHLDCLSDTARITDKVFHIYSLGKERNLDGMEIGRIVNGLSEEEFARTPVVLSIINSSSPLRLDTPMLQGIIEMSRRGQVIVLTPFTLAGAMAPVTLAGALAQQNAEALAGLAFAQMVNPGAPVVYGGFTSNVDMKSGAPAFGTPEYIKAALVGGQLARKYRIPYRSSAVCAANTVDAQAAYETVFSLWGAINGGGNYLKHAAGWLEGGLSAGFEKFIIDVDLLQMVDEYLQPMVVDEASLALDAIRDVGPGGHFFGTEHTQARYKDAFYSPIISDWRNYESWAEAGSPTAYEKANRLYKQVLAEFEMPPLDPAIDEELTAFVERRKEEGGAPTDF